MDDSDFAGPSVSQRAPYRGYEIVCRWCSATGTSRVKRRDGTWRETEPTVVGGAWMDYAVVRREGKQEETLARFGSEAEARAWIDSILA